MLIAATSLTEGGNIARSIGTIDRRYIRFVYMKFKNARKKGGSVYNSRSQTTASSHKYGHLKSWQRIFQARVHGFFANDCYLYIFHLDFHVFCFCEYIIPRGLRFVKRKYTISTKKFEKMQTVCMEGRKKHRSGAFFNFMSYADGA